MFIPNKMLTMEGKPILIVKLNGSILFANKSAKLMLDKLLHKEVLTNIYEIDKEFDPNQSKECVEKNIYIRKLNLPVFLYKAKCENDEDVIIYLIDNIIFNEDVDNLLNAIDYPVNVVNSEGAIEFFNNSGYRTIGLTHADTEPGHNILDHYEKKSTLITEPTFMKALREKRSVIGRASYKTGISLLNRATPIFTRNGEVKRILIVSQDATENAAINEMLILQGDREKDASTIIHLNEISNFFSDQNYIVSSDEMRKVVNTAIKAAASNSSVFIWGESGVGKEMVAKIIHYSSQRKNKPFITINCAAIPSELMESELFGYEKGAFTGAVNTGKKGLLEEANGGTIFLDELGEMPYGLQSKLLRAIQENSIRRIGGNKNISIDVRYISATNLTTERFLDNNVLRSDLYYRLSVVPIKVPPLRERKQDIIPLINHFMSFYNEQQRRTVTLSKKAMMKLINYDWPGNIRELKNVIERTILLAESELVDDIDLFNSTFEELSGDDISMEQYFDVYDNITVDEAYDRVFSTLVKKEYKTTGSIIQTAKNLGINPSTIHRKIKAGKLKLE